MTAKRPASPDLVPNPFIKKRNLGWTLESPTRPSPNDNLSKLTHGDKSPVKHALTTTAAAVEAGEEHITDHLTHFTSLLSNYILSPSSSTSTSLLSIPSYASLYESCAGSPHGAHFVIHQHDHPVAGTHYDLRLQINATSSASWAIMYGLPGDPNSIRLNRNATETRIHCLWNHLIETASADTGSLLIWDTGTYSILPRRSKHSPALDPSSPVSPPSSSSPRDNPSQQTLLHTAFQARKIRLRLHGTRLPDPYVLNLRLTKSEDASGRSKSARVPQRRRRRRRGAAAQPAQPETSSDSDAHSDAVVPSTSAEAGENEEVSAMEREIRELEDEQVRRTNAYTGATNTIGSVHQRRWYLSLDRRACGFVERRRQGRIVWEADPSAPDGRDPEEEGHASFPFYVRGADCERSVVTGRRGEDILRDEGVTGFIPRKGWAPVLR